MGDAVLVTAAAVMGEKHGKHSAHGGDTDCLISSSVSTQSKIIAEILIAASKLHMYLYVQNTLTHTYKMRIIAKDNMVQVAHLHQCMCTGGL